MLYERIGGGEEKNAEIFLTGFGKKRRTGHCLTDRLHGLTCGADSIISDLFVSEQAKKNAPV